MIAYEEFFKGQKKGKKSKKREIKFKDLIKTTQISNNCGKKEDV
jgi:hypothetical protein